jgi:DNA-binding PadR family transcriptional regulator
MGAAHAADWTGSGEGRGRDHHHHHHHRGGGGHRGGWDSLIALMQGRHGPFGFDPRAFWGPGPGGPGGHGGRGGGFGRGPKARRGDVRAAILLLLAEEPQNGYQLIQEIERRSKGIWKPSPGSVYPALQQLEDEGLVRAQETEGRRAFNLTDEGRAYIEANREELGNPWDAVSGGVDEGVMDLRGLMMQVGAATMQVAAAGHVDEARKILAETRRALYRILAEDDPSSEEPREA